VQSYVLILPGLVAVLTAITIADFRKQIIPNAYTALLLVLGAVAAYFTGSPSLASSVLGGLFGFGSFALMQVLYRTIRRREGLGGGDVKFMGAAGVWVGVTGLPWLVLIASISGLLMFAILAISGRAEGQSRLAFGPHLALGLLLTWLAIQRGLM
jgi:leader peptidase (prepilin peptidase) / N-methyltransferase